MKALPELIRKNAGFALLVANIALALIAFVAYDPLELIHTGYAGSELLARAASRETDVREIRIVSPEGNGFSVKMTRLSRVAEQKFDKKAGPSHEWKVRITDGHGAAEYTADSERVRELFSSLREARRYYALKRTPEKDRDLELGTDQQGKTICPQVILVTESGREETLCLGRASGGESYVRAGDETEVFLVQANLRTAIGSQDATFFRNRRVITPEISAAQIEALSAEFPGGNRKLTIAHPPKGGGWELHGYASGPADTAAVEPLLNDIVSWKAVSFPAEVPKSADRKRAATLHLYMKAAGVSAKGGPPGRGREVRLEVLAGKDDNNYFVRAADGTLFEVSSYSLADLFEAETKLMGRSTGGLRLPEERRR